MMLPFLILSQASSVEKQIIPTHPYRKRSNANLFFRPTVFQINTFSIQPISTKHIGYFGQLFSYLQYVFEVCCQSSTSTAGQEKWCGRLTEPWHSSTCHNQIQNKKIGKIDDSFSLTIYCKGCWPIYHCNLALAGVYVHNSKVDIKLCASKCTKKEMKIHGKSSTKMAKTNEGLKRSDESIVLAVFSGYSRVGMLEALDDSARYALLLLSG